MADPAVDYFSAVLKKLRTRDGLTVDRLRDTSLEFHALLRAPAVADAVGDGDEAEELVSAVRSVVAEMSPSTRLVLDAALALHVAVPADHPDSDEFYAPDLMRRRQALLLRWAELHRLLGDNESATAPAMSRLRSKVEDEAFVELARRLLEPSLSLHRFAVARGGEAGTDVHRSGVAIVVGGAAMDCIFRVPTIPSPDTSVRADSFSLHPGGKGLTQAVGLARLGFDVYLAAAVGDDAFGDEILAYLKREGVRTALMLRAHGQTPATGIITLRQGGSLEIAWKNDGEIQISEDDLLRSVKAIPSDLILATFEVSIDTIRRILMALPVDPSIRPITVVTPGPPANGQRLSAGSFSRIDYLVTNEWELRELLSAEPGYSVSQLVAQLQTAGVGCVCLCQHSGATAYARGQTIEVAPFSTPWQESAGSRDAFCAALARRLVDSGGDPTQADFEWATAAMAVSAMQEGIAVGMPRTSDIDRLLERTAAGRTA